MIHVFHTSAAELARRREQLAHRCLLAVALPGMAICYWALATPMFEFQGESDCNFTGVAFIPEEEVADKTLAMQVSLTNQVHEAPAPAVLAAALPEFIALQAEELSIESSETEPPIEDELDTPAEALLAAASSETKESKAPQEKKPDAIASDAGTYTPPAYLHCPQPPYPTHLRQRRACGTVRLIIDVSANGEPTGVTITDSSGHASLDSHAQRWILKNWRFTPASKDGKAITARVSTSITFTS